MQNTAATTEQRRSTRHLDALSPTPDTNGLALFQTAGSPSTDSERRLLTADDVAGVLRVPRSFVYALARRGELPTVRIGERYVRFRSAALETWIAHHESTMRVGTQ